MSIYSPSHQVSTTLNGIGDMSDGSGTINPAALNSGANLAPNAVEPSPRGVKRSRSPDQYGDYVHEEEDDDAKSRKRGRPPKTPRTSGEFTSNVDSLPTPASQTSPDITQTPQSKVQPNLSQQPTATPTQPPPPAPRTTPKSTIKALPTVRDHTSDQLNPEEDEYIPREYDEAGDKKADGLGYLQGGREYKIRTFTLPGRGEKLFMLATECARQLQYRDSYLLFNKNRSLFKIIASVKEKEELVNREILPYSYRSRQIAIVTARSMFRQFGSRVIKDGRRVRDDYWEAKAIKQGFTEQDAAGEKRPGAARAREAAAAADQASARQLTAYGDVVYSNGPGFGALQPPPLHPGVASTMAQLPSFDAAYESKYRDIPRPRQELTGVPYVDITRTSGESEMAGQAGHAAEYSKTINQQGRYRRGLVDEYWHRPHDPPVSTPPPPQETEPAAVASSHPFSSPRFPSNEIASQPNMLAHPQQSSSQSNMNPPSFTHQQTSMHSPVRQSSMQQGYPRDASSQFTPQHTQFPRSSSNLSISQTASQQQPMTYGGAGASGGFSPHGMNPQQQQQPNWGGPPPQPHQSPGLHRMTTPQFSPSLGPGQVPSPLPGGGHPSQSPHPPQMQPPSIPILHHQNSSGGLTGQQLYGPGAGLQAMTASGGYGGMGMPQRAMYGMGGQNQYMQQNAPQPGQGWPGQQGPGQGAGQWGQGFQ